VIQLLCGLLFNLLLLLLPLLLGMLVTGASVVADVVVVVVVMVFARLTKEAREEEGKNALTWLPVGWLALARVCDGWKATSCAGELAAHCYNGP